MTVLTERSARVLRVREVTARLGLSKSAVYGKLKFNPRRPQEYDASFPRQIKIGARSVGFIESEINAWLDAQGAKRSESGEG